MLLKKNSLEAKKSSSSSSSSSSPGSSKMHLAQQSEDIRQSLDVLDRVLSEFDDIETDTNDDSVVPDIADVLEVTDTFDGDGEGAEPPPVDRSLKPRGTPGEAPPPPPPPPPPPELPRKTRLPRPGSGSSSPSSHEYQEINSDMGLPLRSQENIVPPPAPLTSSGGRRQASADRAHIRRHEDDLRRQPRRQRSEDARLRRDDVSSSSGDLMTLDVRDASGKIRSTRDSSRGRSRDGRDAPGRESRESRHLRKSRSGDVETRRVPSQEQGRRRRSRSSDRWLDHTLHPHDINEQHLIDAGMIDPRLIDAGLIDPRLIDPRLIDPRMIDPRLIDPRFMDEPYPLPQDPIRFPHLMGYPPMTEAGPMSPGSMSPIPTGPHMGPPYMPMDYPPYLMYQYDMGYLPDPLLGPEMAFMPPHHPGFPGDIPPQFMHPPEFLPPDYPLDYPLNYGQMPRNPAMMGGEWVGPGVHPREDWPPPTPEQAQKLIHTVVRHPSSRSSGDDDLNDDGGNNADIHSGRRRMGRRLTSIGHSDSSGLSSPSEERRPIGNRKPPSRYHGVHQSFLEASTNPSTPASDFRVGEAVRENSPRVPMKNSTSLPHFSSGKDSGFDEAQVVGDEGNNTGSRGGRPGGGAFIVSGVFNDSSRMFIPAPPSPTPDYDDDGDGDSDGNESDILQGSQFYVVSDQQKYPAKKKVVNRDSLSDDSLQNAPMAVSKSKKASPSLQTPLQTMMKEFHRGLPPPDHETGFSDDSLEESIVSPSGPSSISQRPHRQNSLESLISMESSTASFDYMNEGQARNSSYGRTRLRPAPSVPGAASDFGNKNNNARDRKDLNGKIKKTLSKSMENGFAQKSSAGKRNEKGIVTSNSFNRQNSKKPVEKFDTIRTMLKEGLIEGLDESPPQFKPPPPSKKTPSEERADSGMGSIVSTARTDESGGSDNRSDFSGTPPSLTSPRDLESSKSKSIDSKRGKDTVCSLSSITSEDMERNRDEGDEVEVSVQDIVEIPPPPPPRDESMHWTPRTNSSRNHSRLSLRATPTTPTPSAHRDLTRSSLRSAPCTPSNGKNSSWLHNSTPAKDEMLEVSSTYSHYSTGDKITHVDDLYGQHEQIGSGSEVSSAINGSLASHYSIQDSDNPLTDREFLENLKNLEPRPRPDTLAVITEDQGSIGSKGSRSGRLFSRIADSVRSGSRTPTPNSSLSANTRATTTKLTSTSRASTRIHGDIIREPWRTSLRESTLPSPQEYGHLPSLSPSVIPLTRDGSGRFRSIEDLAEAMSAPSQQEQIAQSGKRKKHSTLPPNLTPADMKKENKELRRATSLMVGKKGKENGEGSKFRFNFFRGFWRRKQYSFDNKM